MTAVLGSAAFVAGLIVGWPVPYGLASVAVVAVLLRRRWWVGLSVVVLFAVAGDLRGTGALNPVGLSSTDVAPYEGEISTYARRSKSGQNLEMELDSGAHLCVRTGLRLRLGRGDRVRIEGEVVRLESYAPSRAAGLRALGCVGTVDAVELRVLRQGHGARRWLDDTRRGIAQWFGRSVPGDRGALLSGLVIGDDDALSFQTQQSFFDLGMNHITAVSGSNLALLTWLLIGRGSRRRSPILDVASLGTLWFYVLLAGAGPSTIRAGLTATLCVIVVRTGRKPDLLSIACLVAAAQVAFDPALVSNLAYQLSTLAMLVMISTLAGRSDHGWHGKATSLVASSVAIQLATLPFTPNENQAIVAGIVANSLAAPLVGLAFTVGMIAAVLQPVSGSAAAAVAVVAEIPTGLILWLVDTVDQSPLADVRAGSLGWLPKLVVRAGLVSVVVIALGRHSRRGIGDVWRAIRRMSGHERAVWASALTGSILGIVGAMRLR